MPEEVVNVFQIMGSEINKGDSGKEGYYFIVLECKLHESRAVTVLISLSSKP